MFDQSAEQPASDPSAPQGMREMPPQPARPVMPAYTLPSAAPSPAVVRVEEPARPTAEDSVIAADDHVEGTFTSRGTIVVMGSLKGRIEAVRLRIEPGASVDAEVIVDEAIVAGDFTGNLTCRERLEARPSGRISGRVETFKLMLHEGASVEGEMHMLTERPRDASETIRGSAPLRGETSEPKASSKSAATPTGAASAASAPAAHGTTPAPSADAATAGAPVPATRPAPVVAPASSAKGRASAAPAAAPSTAAAAPRLPMSPAQLPSVEAILAQRSPAAQTMRIDGLSVAPRTTSSAARQGNAVGSASGGSNGSRNQNGTSSGF